MAPDIVIAEIRELWEVFTLHITNFLCKHHFLNISADVPVFHIFSHVLLTIF